MLHVLKVIGPICHASSPACNLDGSLILEIVTKTYTCTCVANIVITALTHL
jgi:hypothetical protein